MLGLQRVGGDSANGSAGHSLLCEKSLHCPGEFLPGDVVER